MSYCKQEGKDQIIFLTKEDQDEPITSVGVKDLDKEDDEPEEGLILPNGEINWSCPCLGGMASGPCGVEFRDAFSCFHYSEAEPKGSDCIDNFRTMQECMVQYPELYPTGGDERDGKGSGPGGEEEGTGTVTEDPGAAGDHVDPPQSRDAGDGGTLPEAEAKSEAEAIAKEAESEAAAPEPAAPEPAAPEPAAPEPAAPEPAAPEPAAPEPAAPEPAAPEPAAPEPAAPEPAGESEVAAIATEEEVKS